MKKLKSLSVKILGLTCLILLTLSSFQYILLKQIISNRITNIQEQNFIELTESLSRQVSSDLSSYINLMTIEQEQVRTLLASNKSENLKKADIELSLKILSKLTRLFKVSFVANTEGDILYTSDFKIMDYSQNIEKEEFFYRVVKNKEGRFISKNPRECKVDHYPILYLAVPIYNEKNTEVAGLLGAMIDIRIFSQKLVSECRIGQTGYPFAFDQDGTIVIHPESQKILAPVRTINPLLMDFNGSLKKEDFLQYEYKGKPKHALLIKNSDMNWTMVFSMEDDELFLAIKEMDLLLELSSLLLFIVINASLFFFLKRIIVLPLVQMQKLMLQASKGSLAERGHYRGEDEICQTIGYYNTFVESLSLFVKDLDINLNNLEQGGLELLSHMEETSASIQQITGSMNLTVEQIDSQERAVNETQSVMNDMEESLEKLNQGIEFQNNQINEGSSSIEEMIAQIKETTLATDTAKQSMDLLTKSSEKGQEELNHVSSLIENVVNRSKELEQANILISHIASQTNLLAMNAAIEAAHAGEAGRGFAVVADEIRQLAEKSTEQSKQVKESISGINQQINQIVTGAERSNLSFLDIKDHIQKVDEVTSLIRNSMEEQVAGSSQVLQALEGIKQVGEQVKGESSLMAKESHTSLRNLAVLKDISQDVTRAMSEMNQGVNEISLSVSEVSRLTEGNQERIDKVKAQAEFYKK